MPWQEIKMMLRSMMMTDELVNETVDEPDEPLDWLPPLDLTTVQDSAAKMIADNYTQAQVARALRKTKQTINRWVKLEAFKKRVIELRTDYHKQADDLMIEALPAAAKTIADIASGKLVFDDTRELTARLNAAKTILDMAKRGKLPQHTAKTATAATKPTTAMAEAEGTDDEEFEELMNR